MGHVEAADIDTAFGSVPKQVAMEVLVNVYDIPKLKDGRAVEVKLNGVRFLMSLSSIHPDLRPSHVHVEPPPTTADATVGKQYGKGSSTATIAALQIMERHGGTALLSEIVTEITGHVQQGKEYSYASYACSRLVRDGGYEWIRDPTSGKGIVRRADYVDALMRERKSANIVVKEGR